METFMKIKELTTHLTRDCFTNEQALIIMGVDISNENMFFYTHGNILFIIPLLTEYIEKFEKNNPIGMSKFDLLDMIRKTMEEDDKYDQTS